MKLRSPLVNVSWLAARLANDRSGLRILDASLYKNSDPSKSWAAAQRIEGARNFDVRVCSDRNSDFSYTLPSPQLFSDYVGGHLGVSNTDDVIVYGNKGSLYAPRVWWMFRVFGHKSVAVLNGGLAAWLSHKLPVTTGDDKDSITPCKFQAFMSNKELYATFNDVCSVVDGSSSPTQIVDARNESRFKGIEPEPVPIPSGHILNSENLFFKHLLKENSDKFLPGDQLQRVMQDHGVTLNQPIISSCGLGITACYLALAAAVCGNHSVRVFDGSWQEFSVSAPADLKWSPPT